MSFDLLWYSIGQIGAILLLLGFSRYLSARQPREITPVRPESCESWCTSHGYEGCSCDLEARQAAFDASHRHKNAEPLPSVRLHVRRTR